MAKVHDAVAQQPCPEVDSRHGLVDAMPLPVLLLDEEGRVRHANPAAANMLRTTVGAPVVTTAFDADQRGAMEDVLRHVGRSGSWEGELAVLGRDGTPRTCALVATRLADGETALVVEDLGSSKIRARRLAERLTRLAGVTAELLLSDDLAGVTRVVVEHMADVAGATVASLSVLVDADTMRLLGIRGGNAGVERRWETFSMEGTPAGEAARMREPVLLSGAAAIAERYPDLEKAAEGERSILCLPLLVSGRVTGVATLSFPGRRTFDPAEMEFFRVLAATCAQAVDRVQAVAEAADRASKLQFLADATQELTRSLDYEATLRKVAHLAVPWFADWCSIAVAADGELRTVALAHEDPAKVALAEELQRRYPAAPSGDTGSYHVYRTGESELVPDITDGLLDAAVPDAEQRELIRRLDLRSALTVPLKVGDRVLGVVTWVAGQAGRRFSEQDRAFGEDLAGRAAVAIDNAQLHTELREMAMRLQRAVLPAALPAVPGWQVAAHYAPSGRLEAGGDFYDVITLDDGHLAFFVGDVMGRGVHAAAAMAQMRASIRALVAVDPSPAVVLEKLDLLFETYHLDQLVTMVYAVADPARDRVELVNAGHLVPLVRTVDDTVRPLPSTEQPLLGAGRTTRTSTTVPLHRGETLLVFTDGLVERRDEDIDTGQARLAEAFRRLPVDDLAATLPSLVEEVRDRTRDDDVAALALRREPA